MFVIHHQIWWYVLHFRTKLIGYNQEVSIGYERVVTHGTGPASRKSHMLHGAGVLRDTTWHPKDRSQSSPVGRVKRGETIDQI